MNQSLGELTAHQRHERDAAKKSSSAEDLLKTNGNTGAARKKERGVQKETFKKMKLKRKNGSQLGT